MLDPKVCSQEPPRTHALKHLHIAQVLLAFPCLQNSLSDVSTFQLTE